MAQVHFDMLVLVDPARFSWPTTMYVFSCCMLSICLCLLCSSGLGVGLTRLSRLCFVLVSSVSLHLASVEIDGVLFCGRHFAICFAVCYMLRRAIDCVRFPRWPKLVT